MIEHDFKTGTFSGTFALTNAPHSLLGAIQEYLESESEDIVTSERNNAALEPVADAQRAFGLKVSDCAGMLESGSEVIEVEHTLTSNNHHGIHENA